MVRGQRMQPMKVSSACREERRGGWLEMLMGSIQCRAPCSAPATFTSSPISPGKFSHSPSLCYHFHEAFHAPLCRNEMVPVCALLTHCPSLCYTPNDILLQATRLTTHWRRGGLGALLLPAWPDADRPAWPSHHHTHRNTFLQSWHPCHCTLMWK